MSFFLMRIQFLALLSSSLSDSPCSFSVHPGGFFSTLKKREFGNHRYSTSPDVYRKRQAASTSLKSWKCPQHIQISTKEMMGKKHMAACLKIVYPHWIRIIFPIEIDSSIFIHTKRAFLRFLAT